MRRPPMLGVVGVDFGTKPAICFALEKRGGGARRNDVPGFTEEADILGCTDPDALNYNPLATVDDGSCEYSACPELTLVCDSISASKSKCGFNEFTGYASTPPKKYLQKDISIDGSWSAVATGDPDFCVVDTASESRHFESRDVYSSSTCVPTHTQSGSTWGFFFGLLCNACALPPPGCYSASTSTTADTQVITETISGSWSGGVHGCACTQGGTTITATVLSSEFTTATLISNTISALPSYSGFTGDHSVSGQGTTCSAYRDLSTDEMSYSIRRFKYKITFPSATAAFHLNWVERFTPEGGGSPTDTGKTELIAIGDTESSVYTLNEPSTDGTTAIVDIACVLV